MFKFKKAVKPTEEAKQHFRRQAEMAFDLAVAAEQDFNDEAAELYLQDAIQLERQAAMYQ